MKTSIFLNMRLKYKVLINLILLIVGIILLYSYDFDEHKLSIYYIIGSVIGPFGLMGLIYLWVIEGHSFIYKKISDITHDDVSITLKSLERDENMSYYHEQLTSYIRENYEFHWYRFLHQIASKEGIKFKNLHYYIYLVLAIVISIVVSAIAFFTSTLILPSAVLLGALIVFFIYLEETLFDIVKNEMFSIIRNTKHE